MKNRNIILPITVLLSLAGGILIGVFVKDFPFLKLDPAINLIDAASLIVTIAIGILVPFLLKRWIDDTRQIKGYIIEELRDFLSEISEIPEYTKKLFYDGRISPSDKTRINITFETIDNKLSNLFSELNVFYNKETAIMREKLKDSYMSYWKYMTGSEIMSTKFKAIDEAFYKKSTSLYLEIETRIKDIIRLMYS